MGYILAPLRGWGAADWGVNFRPAVRTVFIAAMAEGPGQVEPVDNAKAPPGLVEALGGLYRRDIEVPAAVDRAVLGEARAGFLRRRRLWLARRAGAAAAAVAAAIAIVVYVYVERGRGTPPPVAVRQAAVAGDVDGSGRVDILDAFLLARKVEGGPAAAGEDVNGDGVVDRADVDRVAAMAVSVGEGLQ